MAPQLAPSACLPGVKNGLTGNRQASNAKLVWWKDAGSFSSGVTEPVLTCAALPVAQDLSPSPAPFVGDWTESSSANQSSPELLSPPQTACSTIAVLGSAGLNRTFEEDYDRWEANPDFVRHSLRRSRSLRRQARMRDGDFRDTDDERDYSVTAEAIPDIVPRNAEVLHFRSYSDAASLASGAFVRAPGFDQMPRAEVSSATTDSDSPSSSSPSSVSSSDGLNSRVPSRLSQRVRPPPPIDTHKETLRNGEQYQASRMSYKIENVCLRAPRSLPSDSGFDADDEDESPAMLPVRVGPMPADGDLHAVTTMLAQDLPTGARPTKKTYASVVASSPPLGSRPGSRAAVVQTRGRMGTGASAYDWRPFVEPLDV
ncbi:hypothetical protein K466DRAFT_658792 [Polyporus arcularius HHB13444]|uniref:Uncharacterized protein n=1 Tax=Polyporus arcularius HHB13444 TaxID=1314778 RepID=A0A5C3PZ12_9APHY|nr:hypothetical protein K466DRAFT_658792 [Polyporus arcularius HHB13444]